MAPGFAGTSPRATSRQGTGGGETKRASALNAEYPFPTGGTHAWLFVTDPLPTPIVPGPGTVFHSQWGDTQTCQPIPAPGYTYTTQPGGYWMKRVEDLFAKFKRPFSIDY